MYKNTHLVLGGARSGKSSYAEKMAKELTCPVVYIATSNKSFAADDEEMLERIRHHQDARPSSWQTVEEPEQLAQALLEHSRADNCVLVDCLTLWLTNHLLKDSQLLSWQQAKQAFFQSLAALPGQVIFVSNEVGCGVVPMGKISRQFVDQAGWLHQELAAQAGHVSLVTAGLVQKLK